MKIFYMMYVEDTRGPKKMHDTIEEAREAIKVYRDLGGTRQAYILQVCEVSEGRRVLKLKK